MKRDFAIFEGSLAAARPPNIQRAPEEAVWLITCVCPQTGDRIASPHNPRKLGGKKYAGASLDPHGI